MQQEHTAGYEYLVLINIHIPPRTEKTHENLKTVRNSK
jgi:hypothetical protein